MSASIITSQEDEKNSSSNNKNIKTTDQATLFHRLGGVAVVRTAVEEFYTRLLDDVELSPFFENTKMVILKQHQLEFFKLALTEIPADLDVASMLLEKHDFLFANHGLNEYHFDLVANHFVATLSHLGVAADMIDEAAGVILPLRCVFEQGALKYADKNAAAAEKENNANKTKSTTLLTEQPSPASSASSDKAKADAAAPARAVAQTATVLHAAARQDDAGAGGPREVNLHDKLGGVAALKMVVETFYKRLLEDPELSPFFDDVNMTALKLHQVQFMKIAFTQIPDDMDVVALMRQKHAHLFAQGLNERHFDLVVEHFGATLAAARIEETVIMEAAAVITPLRVVFEQGAMEHAASSGADTLA